MSPAPNHKLRQRPSGLVPKTPSFSKEYMLTLDFTTFAYFHDSDPYQQDSSFSGTHV